MMAESRYAHDCDDCEYLGVCPSDDEPGSVDLYWCSTGGWSGQGASGTVLARYGHRPEEYYSGMSFVGISTALTEAFHRAYARGFIKVVSNIGNESNELEEEQVNG
jgi:hypothetical protein